MSRPTIVAKQKFRVRVFIFIVRSVFLTFFPSRKRVALDNLARSSLAVDFDSDSGESLIQESLNHLSLTLYHSLARVFGAESKIFNKSRKIDNLVQYLNDSGVIIDSENTIEKLLNEDRPLIFMSAHIGAWEELIHLGTLLDRKTLLLSKRMKLKTIQWLWDKSRRKFLPRIDQGQRARLIMNLLQEGGAIADVLDQHSSSKKAIPCRFLGRLAATSCDLSRYALASDALIVPIFLLREPEQANHYRLKVLKIIDPRGYLAQGYSREKSIVKLTQASCDRISEIVSLYPEQWLWIHRRWKLD